ncbi:hypothetical protein RvY_05997 [Ramazzottius varieornatus]|uniref:G-protein coupled receptors family 1 profile domain-containing protein n=1 Tax=Ramazzottius varieornatus TaxID=947166 RepID=A0A1D1V2I0_RAMVA|nr:hypothetical protein RvY_05997 [Ramazzottius varieornatus]
MLEENLSVIIDAENFTIFSHINHTRNSLLIKDGCGFIRTLSFTREYASWIWITRISFPLFLILGTIGNALAIVTVYSDRRGPKRTFLLGLFFSDLWFL